MYAMLKIGEYLFKCYDKGDDWQCVVTKNNSKICERFATKWQARPLKDSLYRIIDRTVKDVLKIEFDDTIHEVLYV